VAALNNIMGLSYHDLDQPQQALAALNRAVELAPENLAYREHRAAVALMAEEPELAQADLEPVLAQEPQNSELRRLHALASMDARDLEAAKNDLQILVESPGATGTDYYNLAAVYLALQEPKAALPHLSRALKLDPLEAEAFKLRGFIYYKNGELDTALQDLERYLELAYQPDPEVSRVVAELESKLGL
jgi:tetratricopeptide (TPR) repeat protein